MQAAEFVQSAKEVVMFAQTIMASKKEASGSALGGENTDVSVDLD